MLSWMLYSIVVSLLMGLAALMLLPILIAIGFSLWAATRPSQPSSP